MSSRNRIIQLAEAIATDTAIVDAYFTAHGIASPSFGIDGPPRVGIPPHEKEVFAAHTRVLGATQELHSLMLGPMGMLMSSNANDQLSLHGVYHFKMASTFAPGTESTFADIAEKCNVNVMDTTRLLRHAMTNHIFCEPQPGVVAHTAASKLLAENDLIDAFVGMSVEEHFPAAPRVIDALQKFGYSQDPGHSGWSVANNTREGMYSSFDTTLTERGQRWGKALSAFAGRLNMEPLLNSFDWNSFKTIVDVGGGYGAVSVAIAEQFAKPSFIIQDMEHVVADAGRYIDEKLKGRFRFQAYNFLEPQPTVDADVYFFRAIFHNWPDAYCIRILRNQIPALERGAKLVIVDPTVPEPGVLPAFLEKRRRNMDINMLTYFGARQKTVENWKEMLQQADQRFVLDSVLRDVVEACLVLEVRFESGEPK